MRIARRLTRNDHQLVTLVHENLRRFLAPQEQDVYSTTTLNHCAPTERNVKKRRSYNISLLRSKN
jgi:hypothetical protein